MFFVDSLVQIALNELFLCIFASFRYFFATFLLLFVIEYMSRHVVLKYSEHFVGDIDCFAALAHVALYNDWVQPTMAPSSGSHSHRPEATSSLSSALHIAQLRHPILESLLGSTHYVPSSLTLSDGYTACLLTGPNMGGKSTFMRAVAICVVLAHMGSFVPAKEAIIPIFGKLYMRIGAADCSYTGTFDHATQEV